MGRNDYPFVRQIGSIILEPINFSSYSPMIFSMVQKKAAVNLTNEGIKGVSWL
jgi:hypothetical protein